MNALRRVLAVALTGLAATFEQIATELTDGEIGEELDNEDDADALAPFPPTTVVSRLAPRSIWLSRHHRKQCCDVPHR